MARKINLILGVVIMLMVVLTSCEKYEKATPVEISTKESIKVSGKVFANLNLQLSGNELAPAGTTIFVKVPLSLLTVSGPTNAYKIYSGKVSQTGTYEVTIPNPIKDGTITIYGQSFTFDQIQADGTTKLKYYTLNNVNVSVRVYENVNIDLTYVNN